VDEVEMKRFVFPRGIGRTLVVALTAAFALVSTPLGVPSATAEPCSPDVEVVFARGTGEPAGVGGVGQAFVDALRS
jgi:cutinase